MRQWGWIAIRPNSALVAEICSTSIGNLGDQAMIGGLVEILKQRGITDIGIVTFGSDNPWKTIAGTHHAFALKGMINSLILIWRMSHYERFYYPGADVIDGAYSVTMVRRALHLATMADRLGLKAAICGFSFNKEPEPLALEYLRRIPPGVRLCCRDLPSQSRLRDKLQRNVELVSDVAFCFPPDDASSIVQQVKHWIAQQRRQGRLILGVNVHEQLIENNDTSSAQELLEKIAYALTAIATQRKIAFIFIPHVYRSARNDLEVLRDLRSCLNATLKASTLLIEEKCSAGEAKAIAGMVDLVFSGRMHLAIASLSQGVPVICLTYQDKFEGLMQHFGLRRSTIPPQLVLQGEDLSIPLLDQLNHCDELKQQICKALPRVLEQSRANVL